MSTQLISPGHARHLDIRCTVEDVALSNVAIHVVFFFDRRLDAGALADSFARALTNLPVFAGRLALVGGTLRLRCTGQGAPFTVASSGQTLSRAIRSVSESDGGWLIDAVNGPTARWGFGPLCRVRVTHLADDATAIGFSWHHTIGDMQTAMHFMNAWAATAADRPLAEPVIVEDRVAYLDAQLPAGGAREPGVRCLGFAETARSLVSMARNWRTLRTWTAYFSDDEIAGLRQECGTARRVSVNDVVCAQVAEALMTADSAVNHRVLALAVNVRNRLGLDPMLVGNIVTALNVELRRGEPAPAIAERIRHDANDFVAEHCDMRANQQFLDDVGAWRGTRCVAKSFNPDRWNPVISNWSGFGVYRIGFEGTATCYFAPVLQIPFAGFGVFVEGADGRGLVFQMALPPKDFQAMSSPAVRDRLHRFRRADDDGSRLQREVHG